MKKNFKLYLCGFLFLLFVGLFFAVGYVAASFNSPVKYQSYWMDSVLTFDPALVDSSYRLSTRVEKPTPKQLETPVLIAVHGFSASTFETLQLRLYLEKKGLLVSQVLLGGHGRSREALKTSTWHEWQRPILDEYLALQAKGYKHIGFVGVSTGGTLVLDLLSQPNFKVLPQPQFLIFVDAFIEPRNKSLYWVKYIQFWAKNYIKSNPDETKKRFWYVNLPAESLVQLNELRQHVQGLLHQGIVVPSSTKVLIFQANHDPTVDNRSAVLIQQGLKGVKPVVYTVQSNQHALIYRSEAQFPNPSDRVVQTDIFETIFTKVR